MPTPRKNEKHDDFIERCIPLVIEEGTAQDGAQAKAICESFWDEDKKDRFILDLEADFRKRFSKSKSIDPLPIENLFIPFGTLNPSITRQTENITWYWDESAKQYRTAKGVFLKREKALELALESINASKNQVSTIVELWGGGTIDSRTWNSSFRQVVKDEYIRQYLAGYGGRERMTQSDWGRIGGMLKNQYGYIDNFENDLIALSNEQIEFRMNLYINSAHQANERAHAILGRQWGADTVKWKKDPTAENCETCLRRDAEDPQPMGANGGYMDPVLGVEVFPGDGNSDCVTNCRCDLELTNSATGAVYEG